GDYVVDTREHPACGPVWALYQQTLGHLGPVSALLERDDHVPPFEELLTELIYARELGASALARRP
ncbi:multinuclear nonheme iron-dependent oxidase, partial [Pseudomonas fluorescens]